MDQEAAENPNKHGYRAAPIMLSLENHCDAHGQMRLVQIMKEVLGDRLLSTAVEGDRDPAEHISLAELGSKVVVMVEYHLPDEADSSDSDSSSDEDDEAERAARAVYKSKKREDKERPC